MSTPTNSIGPSPEQTWQQFVARVAEVADVSPDELTRETRFVEDLGLDSLALVEIVVALLVDFGLEELSENLQDSAWVDVTLGMVYDEYRTQVPRPPQFQWT
jgi:acyl carrier protein